MLENRVPYITFILMAVIWAVLVFSNTGHACDRCANGEKQNVQVQAVSTNHNLVNVQITGMTCQMCVNAVLHQLTQLEGVGKDVIVSLESNSASFALIGKKSLEDIINQFNQLSPSYKLALK